MNPVHGDHILKYRQGHSLHCRLIAQAFKKNTFAMMIGVPLRPIGHICRESGSSYSIGC